VTERWTDKQGAKQERTDWFRCTYWKPSDKVAIAQYLKKGTKVLVEGKASARAWQGQTGELNATLELNVANIEFLSSLQQAQPAGSTVAPTHVNGAPVNTPGAAMQPTPQFQPGYVAPAASGPMNSSERIAQANAGAMPVADDEDLPF
jgi:single-strand DNA-binding protein